MTDLGELLRDTSRTFALAIPLLPEPTRQEVTIAYLLFRIADTFEDATQWRQTRRIEALHQFTCLLKNPTGNEAHRWASQCVVDSPCAHEGYLKLLSRTPEVLHGFLTLSERAQEIIREHTIRTAEGMARFVARTRKAGVLRLRNVSELREYCYVVAGSVGEMLTELFLLGRDYLQPIASFLRERASPFGEALQLVNILKDVADDTEQGRSYLPEGIDHGEIFALARKDLRVAGRYVLALQNAMAPRGLVAFTALPVRLAWATLERLEQQGPGSKLTRKEVFEIAEMLEQSLDQNQPAVVGSSMGADEP
ncbi:MAG: squalene/phytoene synthase family protein [Proteobacteria bacterium]|nr:squalene/phytoene synthase family protein [Pseudomonadota bacterium]